MSTHHICSGSFDSITQEKAVMKEGRWTLVEGAGLFYIVHGNGRPTEDRCRDCGEEAPRSFVAICKVVNLGR